MPLLVLASRSPRRRALLRLIDSRFVVRPARTPEIPLPGEAPERCAVRLAREKALAAFEALSPAERRRAIVIGADTIVAAGGRMLGKPADAADAKRMLRLLSGRRHRVVTGMAVLRGADGKVFPGRSVTQVVFRPLTDREIADYVRTREPMDAAGAYRIQGRAALFIPRIEGSYSNVVGFPVDLAARLIARAGARAS